MCYPKHQGGLGLRDSEKSSEVLGAKLWWNWVMIHKEEPWEKLWHIKDARERSKNDLIRFNEEKQGSNRWRISFEGRSIIQDHSFGEIRDREPVEFWDDLWQQIFKLSSQLNTDLSQARSRDPRIIKVNQFGNDEMADGGYHEWKPLD